MGPKPMTAHLTAKSWLQWLHLCLIYHNRSAPRCLSSVISGPDRRWIPFFLFISKMQNSFFPQHLPQLPSSASSRSPHTSLFNGSLVHKKRFWWLMKARFGWPMVTWVESKLRTLHFFQVKNATYIIVPRLKKADFAKNTSRLLLPFTLVEVS